MARYLRNHLHLIRSAHSIRSSVSDVLWVQSAKEYHAAESQKQAFSNMAPALLDIILPCP